jgi:hypothetical protein
VDRRRFFGRLTGAVLGTAAVAAPKAPVRPSADIDITVLRSPDEDKRIVDAVLRAIDENKRGLRTAMRNVLERA